MIFLKRFRQIFESFFDINCIGSWKISYYHNSYNHDLEDRIRKRTYLNNKTFNFVLNKIIEVSENDNINGSWVFISFKYKSKIITDIESIKKRILIITVLGPDEEMRETKNIKFI